MWFPRIISVVIHTEKFHGLNPSTRLCLACKIPILAIFFYATIVLFTTSSAEMAMDAFFFLMIYLST